MKATTKEKIKKQLTILNRSPIAVMTSVIITGYVMIYIIRGADIALDFIYGMMSGLCLLIVIIPLGSVAQMPVHYTTWIKNINWDFYLKSNGDLIQLSYILRPFGVFVLPSLMILGVMIWQGFDTKILFSRQLLDDVHIQGSKLLLPIEGSMDFPLNFFTLFAISLVVLKWCWFLSKTPKMKEKLIFSSPYLLEEGFPVPKYTILFALWGIIYLPVVESFDDKYKGINVSKILFEKTFNLDDSIRIRFLDTVFVFMDIFMWSFVVFCVVALLVYIVKTFQSDSYLPQEQDIEFQNDVKKLRKLYLTRGYDLDSLSQIYITEGIDADFVKIMKHIKYLQSKNYGYNKNPFQDVNIARDTIAWMIQEPDIEVYPRVVDLLYMVGFSLSNLLSKGGGILIIFWLLASRIEMPLYVLFICIVEHFVFVDVQIWYYMRYFRDYGGDGRFELLKHVNINEDIHTFYDR